jgi:hypothetical protein
MAEAKLPYVVSTGSLSRALEKIQSAATPDRFTQDFLATKLGLKGGSPKPVIPFLKRIGFLASDGAPTELYKKFRNPRERGAAAAQALQIGYDPLFQSNEYAHELEDAELRGLIVQVTGIQEDSRVLTATLASFKVLRDYAVFDGHADQPPIEEPSEFEDEDHDVRSAPYTTAPPLDASGLNIGYTINLHLPPTSDIAVFNAIFKSLRENLLR